MIGTKNITPSDTQIFNEGRNKDKNEETFPKFTQSGKILISVEIKKLFMYIEILRATITKTIQRDMLKSTTYKSTEFLKDVQVTHRKTGKEKQKSDDRPKEKNQ